MMAAALTGAAILGVLWWGTRAPKANADRDDVRLIFTTIILEVPPDIPASGIKCNRLNL